MAQLLEQSGCVRLDVGLESADNQALARMHKGYTRDHIQHFLSLFRGRSIQLLCNIIVDYPGLSYEQALDAYQFLEEATAGVNVHFEVLRFALTRTSEMYCQAAAYGLEIDHSPRSRTPSIPLPFNSVRFQARGSMSPEQVEAITMRYNELNYRTQEEHIVATSRTLKDTRQHCPESQVLLRLNSGPYIGYRDEFIGTPTPADRAPEGLLRNLATRQTYLVPAHIPDLILELTSRGRDAISLQELQSWMGSKGYTADCTEDLVASLIGTQVIWSVDRLGGYATTSDRAAGPVWRESDVYRT
jgi:hypothetical protein